MPRTTSTGYPTSGSTFALSLTGPRNQPVLLLLGRYVDQNHVVLPLDLSSMGAPGCHLDLNTYVTLIGRTDATGRTTVPFQVPLVTNTTPNRMRVQWLALSPGTNQANLAVSPSATLVIRSR